MASRSCDGISAQKEAFLVSQVITLYVSIPTVVKFEFADASYQSIESSGTAEIFLSIQGQCAFNISYTVFTFISVTDTAEGML